MRFLRISSKMAQRIFLIFRQNIELNSVFQPAKIVCENHFRSGVISDKDAYRGSLLNDLLLSILYLAQKRMDIAEIFKFSNDPLILLR